MLLVPYPFASILSIVFFPSPRFFRICTFFIFGLRAVYSFACLASQTQGLCSAFPRSPFEFLRFCLSRIVLRTSPHKHRVCSILNPRSPLKFVRLCLLCYVMRTSPHKHRVCAVLFPRFPLKFVRLCLLCYVMRTSPHKHRVLQCFFLGSLFSLYAYVSQFVMRASPHKHRDWAVLASQFPLLKFVPAGHNVL